MADKDANLIIASQLQDINASLRLINETLIDSTGRLLKIGGSPLKENHEPQPLEGSLKLTLKHSKEG